MSEIILNDIIMSLREENKEQQSRIHKLETALHDIIYHDMVYLTWAGSEFDKIIYIASKGLEQ